MCGRFTLLTSPEELSQQFGLSEIPDLSPRYNIAPTQQVAAVRTAEKGQRELVLLRWGLIPSWADSPAIGVRLLNARAETVADKPSFRSALKQRRCLIPADGFFEWQSVQGRKRPYYFREKAGRPLAFAGLWEHWERGGQAIHSCTIITTEANAVVKSLHDRMPVILLPDAYALWLDRTVQRPEQLVPLLRPFPAEEMIVYPVSLRVNSPRNDDSGCVQAVA